MAPTCLGGAIAGSGRFVESELLRYPTSYRTLCYELVKLHSDHTIHSDVFPRTLDLVYLMPIHFDRPSLNTLAELRGGDRGAVDHPWRGAQSKIPL